MSSGMKQKFNVATLFPAFFAMIGCTLIYVNHGMNEYLVQIGFPKTYDFTIREGIIRGFLLGLVNFVILSFLTDQAFHKKPSLLNMGKFVSKLFHLKIGFDFYAHLSASFAAISYFITNITALLLTPGTFNPNFIILIFGLGSVTSLSVWMQIFFYHYPLNERCSIERLKTEQVVWLELIRQFIFIGITTATGLVVYGVVNWLIATPPNYRLVLPFQLTLFSLAVTCIYIYTGYFLGVISPILIFLGKVAERIEEIERTTRIR